MTHIEELAAFITARLDEDEQAAREAYYEGQRWLAEEEEIWRWPDDEPVHSADRKADARHIALHDPGRVLREVEGKRAVLIALGAAAGRPDWASAYGIVLRCLALSWSGDPDYREEWKP